MGGGGGNSGTQQVQNTQVVTTQQVQQVTNVTVQQDPALAIAQNRLADITQSLVGVTGTVAKGVSGIDYTLANLLQLEQLKFAISLQPIVQKSNALKATTALQNKINLMIKPWYKSFSY